VPDGAKEQDEAMTNQSVSRHPEAPEEDLRDLVARLYRDIGISALAAALEAISKRDVKDKSADQALEHPVRHGEDLAA
jgi:hypothetical protein